MTVLILYMLIGGAGLFFGGDWLVKGSASLALRFKMSAYLVGLTVVSFGTSTPELFISAGAAFEGNSGISLGNIVGSNVANIGLILGVSGLLAVISINKKMFKFEWPLLLLVSVGHWLVFIDGDINRWEGLALLSGLLIFIYRSLRHREEVHDEEGVGLLKNFGSDLFFILIGLVFLYFGSQFFIEGAVGIAKRVGIPEIVIGISLVAVGTSLPELVTSIVAAIRGKIELVIGNVIGSNLYNICLVQSVVALIHPFAVDQETEQARIIDLPAVILFTLILCPLFLRRLKLGKLEGCFLLLGYAIYLGITISYSKGLIAT